MEKVFSADGGASGGTVTVNVSPGAGSDAFNLSTGGSRTYYDASPILGSTSVRLTSTAATSTVGWDAVFNATAFYVYRFYLRCLADTSANSTITHVTRIGAGNGPGVMRNTGNVIVPFQVGGLGITGNEFALTQGVDYLVEGLIAPGTTTANGRYKYRLATKADPATALVSMDRSDLNTGTLPIDSGRFGQTNATGSQDILLDGILVSDQRTDLAGPLSSIDLTINDILGIADPGFSTAFDTTPEGLVVGNDYIFKQLVDAGYTTGTIMDRERARLLAKTAATPVGNTLQDLYRIANERPRL